MGLFSFIGKAVKGVAKIATGALKIGGALGILPGGGLIGKVAGTLLGAKQPMSTTALKFAVRSPQVMRGNATQAGAGAWTTPTFGYRPPPSVLRLSPVMPGGAVATPSGIAPRSASPPAAYTGGYGRTKPKKRRKSTAKKRRRSSGRKLKFGSPAWRKKYMKRRRRAA